MSTGNGQPRGNVAPSSKPDVESKEEDLRFSSTEEANLVAKSNEIKDRANDLFRKSEYDDAILAYNEALNSCPRYLQYEQAVIKSNIAACFLHTEAWKDAVKVATEALELLDPSLKKEKGESSGKSDVAGQPVEDEEDEDVFEDAHEAIPEEADEEIISEGAQKAENTLSSVTDKRKDDIERIKSKALLRRARGRTEIGGWSALTAAEEDYKTLSTMSNLSPADNKLVQRQLSSLPARTKKAQDAEMAEMMSKLKGLGNSILKPFGMSTDNFNMVKDEKTGGYSMNFNQGGN